MKKIYVILAVAAIALCASSCGNKKAKEQVAEPTKVEQAVDSVKAVAAEAVEEGIDAAAQAAKDAVKGE